MTPSHAPSTVHLLFLVASGQATTRTPLGNLVGGHRETVGDWLRSYANAGLAALLTIHTPPGATARLTPAARADLERALPDPQGFPSYAAIRDWLWPQHGSWYSSESLGNLCRATWGTRSKVARPAPQKTPDAIPPFEAMPGDPLVAAVPPTNDRPVRVCAQDESRWSLRPIQRRRITAQGVKPIGTTVFRTETTWRFGAVDPTCGGGFWLIRPRLNAAAMQLFLDAFAQQHADTFHILIRDNSSAHTAKRLRIPTNVALVFQPPHGPEVNPVERVWQELRLTLANLRQAGTQQMHRQMALLRLLDRLWPGALGNARRYQQSHPDLPPLRHLVDTRPLERQRVRVLLEHCPDPHAIRALGADGIQALFRQHGVRCGPQTAHHVRDVFAQAVLLPPALCAALARQTQQAFQRYAAEEELLATLEADALALLPQTSGQVLTTLPGSSPLLAARYLAGIGGDATRFPSAKHIWSYAGYDPISADSGNGTYVGHISHQGSAYLRVTLFQLGFLASQHSGTTARVYVRARERGLGEVPACIHAAHQVNQVCYALLTTQQPYRERLSDAEAQHWREQARAWRQRKTRQRAR